MQEQTTYPALLAIETMPAPLSQKAPLAPVDTARKSIGSRGLGIAVAVVLVLWALTQWW
ncbi:hypothetical protein [Rhodoferax lacus]|uniref:hypothetical protein n=1 Tax=Rhodoferax lacus TaxID=2184758 RepID=UPI00131422E0|nr:hypothetical protein [Rhodoferax lacus]